MVGLSRLLLLIGSPIAVLYSERLIFLQPLSHNDCNLEHVRSLGCSHFARHYFGNRVCFLFFGYLDVSVLQMLSPAKGSGLSDITRIGFPHSEIPGSTLAEQLTEAYRS